jgi:hypothetical protein
MILSSVFCFSSHCLLLYLGFVILIFGSTFF